MAADIELFAEATRTTTTYTETVGSLSLQPREADAAIVGNSVDLADNRACSVALTWTSIGDAVGIADVSIETSEDNLTFREVARFASRPTGDGVGAERLSFVADRYLRGRARVVSRMGQMAKGAVRFALAGRATGSAT